MQHCIDTAWHNGSLYIADTYNGSIRRYDPEQKLLTTVLLGLAEPSGLLFLDGSLFVSSTNDHKLVKVDLETWESVDLIPDTAASGSSK